MGARSVVLGPGDSHLDQLLLAEPAPKGALGSSRWVWLALCGIEGVKKRQLRLPNQKRRGEGKRGKQCVPHRQTSGCGAESGELRVAAWGLNFPAIRMTPGFVLIGQGTSPNPSPVFFSVWSLQSSIQCYGEWTKARDEKGGLPLRPNPIR